MFKELFTESKIRGIRLDYDYDDIYDLVNDYGSLDIMLSREYGIRSVYDEESGDVTYQLNAKDYKTLQSVIKDQKIKMIDTDVPIVFRNIKTKRDFDKLTSPQKLAVVWNNLTGDTSIQGPNIKDLKVKTGGKNAKLWTKYNSVTVGPDADSGIEDLPFGLTIKDLKKLKG